MAPMERPDAVARALSDWLRAAAGDPADPARRSVASTGGSPSAFRASQVFPMLEAPSA
jgi:hypothetical protein